MKPCNRSILMSLPLMAGAASVCAPAQALEVFGELNMSRQEITEGDTHYSSIRSNGSAIGISDVRELENDVTALFMLEYEIRPDQPIDTSGGMSEEDPLTLSTGYIGLEGRAGQLKIGYFSTPLKQTGVGVDLFTDMKGDISGVISTGDVDISDAIMYTSPEWQGLQASISHVSYEDETQNRSDGASLAVSYQSDDLFAGVAYDSEVEGDDIDLFRAVIRYPVGPVALGAIWECRDVLEEPDTTSGWLVSADTAVNDQLSLQLQHGRSDNRVENGVSTSGGATYMLGEGVSLYLFATKNRSSETDKESEYGTGISYIF